MVIPPVPPLDEEARAAARARQSRLTKPEGSLGRLEELSLALAAMEGRPAPSASRKAVLVFAGDHGVVEEGVSAYPAEVTAQMVRNFLRGGAALNVLARQAGARVVVVNAGVKDPLAAGALPEGGGSRLVDAPVASGSANLARGPAMTRVEAERALELGLRVLEEEADRGLDVVALGEMGIGNTTAAAALAAAFTGRPAREVVGRGTGVDDRGLARKIEAVERGLRVNRPDPGDPLGVLAALGGLEIAALAGAVLGAAARRVPVTLDGFIAGAAALSAVALEPAARGYLIASHRSVEPGHALVLERLGLRPLLDLDLRLGEGTGALLALPLIEAAARLLQEMATFEEARVSSKR